jgi:tetratricopeptide (TPR) repeat protein
VKPAQVHNTFHWVQGEQAYCRERIGLLLSASGRPADGLAMYQEGLAILQKYVDAHPKLVWMKGTLAESLSGLATVQTRAGRPAEAAASLRRAITLLEKLPSLTPSNDFDLACCHAQLAAVATEAGSGLTAEQGAAEAERAMAELRRAVAAGFSGVGRLRSDVALDALRKREDFQTLVKELDAKVTKALETVPQPPAK